MASRGLSIHAKLAGRQHAQNEFKKKVIFDLKRLHTHFFNDTALNVAKGLLGKVIVRHFEGACLQAMIVETEAYYKAEKSSHSSLGYTDKRRALFMPPGTIYMYYARGKDSMNVSCRGAGNAVLIKAGKVFTEDPKSIAIMQRLNPGPHGCHRPLKRLCSGQTLLCRSLHIKVTDWDAKNFDDMLFIADVAYVPNAVVQTTRLGIPPGRDEHLTYRFVDKHHADYATQNPLKQKKPFKILLYP